METTRQVINVFLASPSDLNLERAVAEEIVITINKLTGHRLGWQIDLHKWEDTAPGYGRPQGQINPMVDNCDLFVGLLWERWGQPSGTHTSGFEEEFERARERRKSQDKPEIWLVFKEVQSDKLKDPGDQLKKVIEFRSKQEALREVLYANVRDADDWKNKLQNWLLGHILDRVRLSPATPQQPAGTLPARELSEVPPIEPAFQGADQTGASTQLMKLSSSLSETFRFETMGISVSSESSLSEFSVVRLLLLSATLISQRYTREVFGTHEINLIYKHREHLEATGHELSQLRRTVVASSSEAAPGWYWFREMEEDTVRTVLFMFACQDDSEDVREGALGLLTVARIKVPEEWWPLLPLDHHSFRLRNSAFSYLKMLEDPATVIFLERMAAVSSPTISAEIEEGRAAILSALDPPRAFSMLLEKDSYIPVAQLEILSANMSYMDEELLLKGTDNQWEEIRKISTNELVRRGVLSVTVAQALMQDTSFEVREIAIRDLASKGVISDFKLIRKVLKTPEEDSLGGLTEAMSVGLAWRRWDSNKIDADSIILTVFRMMTAQGLRDAADWFSTEGHLAYRALAVDHFESFSDELRFDLADGFKRFKEESMQRAEKGYPGTWEPVRVQWEKLGEFITSQFTESALIGLAKHAQAIDAELARPYLANSNGSIRRAAVSIISKVGSWDDVPALLHIAKETYGEVGKEAAVAALNLSLDPSEVAKDLLLSSKGELMKLGYSWMLGQNSDEARAFFKAELDSSDETNRARALNYFSKRLQRKDLESMLTAYIENNTYYYNVVAWLDRLLYSPSVFKAMFLLDLEKQATG